MTRYCPNGDGAFEDWVEKCPECGATLGDEQPGDGVDSYPGGEADLVWLTTAPNQPEAEMWADTIRSEGIRVLMKAGGPGFGAWASVSMFEHHLYVHRRDLRRARDIATRVLNVGGGQHMNTPRRSAVPTVNPVRRPR
jgi:hypothetical protein